MIFLTSSENTHNKQFKSDSACLAFLFGFSLVITVLKLTILVACFTP
ncbi:DUF3265 domain-containing protein [Vibrio kanaloae]|nr:DUF3265 domain-containing protein [Vibrio kanaloae]